MPLNSQLIHDNNIFCMQVQYIKHGNKIVADSALTSKYLKATYGNPPANGSLMLLDLQLIHYNDAVCLQVPYIKHGNTIVADSALTIKYLKATYGDPPVNKSPMPHNPRLTHCNDVFCLQVPYIKHGNTIVADSALTIKYLKATYGDPPANASLMPLNPMQQAQSTALIALALDRILYAMLYHRFVVEAQNGGRSGKSILHNMAMSTSLTALALDRIAYAMLYDCFAVEAVSPLSSKQQAQSTALIALALDRILYAMLYHRFVVEAVSL